MKIRAAGRVAAAGIAATAWAGLAIQLAASYRLVGSAPATLWIVFAYFTIWTNLLVAVVFTGNAITGGALSSNRIVAGTMLCILLVGATYAILLHGLSELSGGSALANVVLHMVTPVLVPLFWIVFTRKGDLQWRDPLTWAIYPLVYLLYGLIRGGATSRYAYPFMDVLRIGWRRAAVNCAILSAFFLLSGFAIVWIDHQVARRIDRRLALPG